MKKLLVIKKIVTWTLVLSSPVLFALSHYYGNDFDSMSLGNKLYVFAIQAILAYDLLENGFKWLKSPKRPIVAGDVVQLKSGGPRMVVTETSGPYGLLCCWFCEKGYNEKRVAAHSLKLA